MINPTLFYEIFTATHRFVNMKGWFILEDDFNTDDPDYAVMIIKAVNTNVDKEAKFTFSEDRVTFEDSEGNADFNIHSYENFNPNSSDEIRQMIAEYNKQ